MKRCWNCGTAYRLVRAKDKHKFVCIDCQDEKELESLGLLKV